MRKLQKLFWSLMIIAMVGGFSACSNADDDDLLPETPGSGGGTEDPSAPVNYLKEDFNTLTDNSIINMTGWTTELVESGESGSSYVPRNWQGKVFNGNAYAQGNAYNCPDGNYEFWLFTPALNVKDAVKKVFSFGSVYYSSGAATNTTAEVYVMQTNKSTDPTKVKITVPSFGDDSQNFISTGDLSLEGKGDVVYIGFRYRVDGYVKGTDVKSWRIDNFLFGANVSEDPNPGGDGTGTGTKADPYNVTAAKSHQGETNKWVKGYIVGQYNVGTASVAVFAPPFEPGNAAGEGTNMLIAESADVKDVSKCLSVKLVGDLRNMSLVKDLANLGKEVLLQGSLETYFQTAGIVPTGGILNGTTYGTIVEDDMFNVPEISISDLRAMYQGTDLKLTAVEKKIVGVVISDNVGENATSKKSVVVATADNSAGINLYCAADASFVLGDKLEILVKGQTLSVYNKGNLQLNGIPLVNIKKVASGITVAPKVTTLADLLANINKYEATLITIQGTMVASRTDGKYGVSSAHTTNMITKDAASIESFVAKFANFINTAVPTGEKTITGIAGLNADKPQLNIRNASDVK